MPTEGLLFYFCVFFVFLAIGVVATKLKNAKLLGVIAGLMVGGLLGLILAIFWAAWTGNLMMAEDDYERGRAATATGFVIIGGTAMIGAFIGFVRTRKMRESP